MAARIPAAARWILTFTIALLLAQAFRPAAEAAILNPDGSPVASDPNLVGWWKADAITGVGDGVQLATWIKSSASGSDATQANGAYQPTYVASSAALGGQPAVRFDGVDDFLGTVGVIPAVGNAPRTIIAVLNNAGDTATAYRHAIHYGTAAGFSAYGLTPKTFPIHTGGGSNIGNHYWGIGFSSFEAPDNDPRAVMVSYDGTKDALWSNGLYQGAREINLTTGNATSLQIGSRVAGPAETLLGEVAEVIVYNQALTGADRKALEGYLRAKYALPSAPVDLTTVGGVQAKYVVGLGRAYSDTVIPGKADTGVVEIGSGRGNGLPWWAINDGIISDNQNINTFGASADAQGRDYMGYQFKVPVKNISRIDFANRIFPDGGSFDSAPTVQYLDAPVEQGGTWHDLAVTWTTPYDRSLGNGVRPYTIVPDNRAMQGIWGIRLIGQPNLDSPPGDSDGFVALTELRVVGDVDLPVHLGVNLALQSNGGTAIMNQAQGGNPGLINDGNLFTREQTFGVVSPTGEDYVGVTWQTSKDFVNTVGITFHQFFDGGVFDDNANPMRIEVTYDGSTWVPVTGLDKYRYGDVYPYMVSFASGGGVQFDNEQGFLFTFDPVSGIRGIRAIGDPQGTGDGDGFLGVLEFEVFSVVPEPSTMVLLACGGLGLVGLVWRRRKRAAT